MSEVLPGSPGRPTDDFARNASPRHIRQTPGRVELYLASPDLLFDRLAEPSYPHPGPLLDRSIAKFLVDTAREQRSQREIEVVVVSGEPPLASSAEEDVRTHLHRFFADEAELASLDQRINRSEGLGSLRYSIPLVVVALLVAGLFYVQLGGTNGVSYLEALTYLVFITIVWVLLWDPLEMLLFNSYLLRLRVRAFHKLARAKVIFAYRPSAVPPPPPINHAL